MPYPQIERQGTSRPHASPTVSTLHVTVEAHRQPATAIRHGVADECHIQKSNAKAPAVRVHRPVSARHEAVEAHRQPAKAIRHGVAD